MKVISNTIFSLPIISIQWKQQWKILIIQFLAIVCLFPAISCKQLPRENICDPYSKANISTVLLKFISNDSSAHCGINCSTLVSLQMVYDEINWTARNLPNIANWYAVTYGNGCPLLWLFDRCIIAVI